MILSNNKNGGFIKIAGAISASFQLLTFFFFQNFPLWWQVVLTCSFLLILASIYLTAKSNFTKTASYLYVFSLFAYQALIFIYFSGKNESDIGSAFMLGSMSIVASIIFGYTCGVFLTGITLLIVFFDLYVFKTYSNFKYLIVYPKYYTILSIIQPAFIINYLSHYFYHALALEKHDKNELKFRLAKVLDNSLQTIVLIDKNLKILYADIKSRELVQKYLKMELIDGEEISQYIIPELRNNFKENVKTAFKGEKVTLESKVNFDNNQLLWFFAMYSPLYDLKGEVDAVQFSLIDITAQKHVQQELQKAEERWKYALTSSQDGVWDWSVKDGKAFFSRTYKEMLGYDESELENSFAEWEKLIHPDDKQKAFETVLQHVKNKSENYILEHRLLKKSGEYLWILARGKIIERDEHGNPVRFIGTHTDIDHIKKVEQDLISAQEKAEMAAEAKSQFLSTISHEIRTPLNAVIGFSNLLLRENPDTQNHEYLQNIQTSANHLLSLVNNVLDISKIESGKIEFEKREFDLEKLLKENISMLSLRAEEKNILLCITKTPFIESFLIGDPFRLTQILNNLLGNAVKFTEKGKVELSVEVLKETNTIIELNFIVFDTGPGISLNKQVSIFESFTQASIETARKFGGTGLGLSISKQLINLQGGEIGVESILGKGASFHFTLKFKKGKNLISLDTISSSESVNSLLGLRILIAEDNIFNTKVLTRFLELWEAEYEVAENGEMVIELLQQNSFDLILMDLHMPHMDGYEATRIIRESGSNIYIMALTASANFNSNDEIKIKGFDSYLYKPVNTKDLFNKLKEIQLSKLNGES